MNLVNIKYTDVLKQKLLLPVIIILVMWSVLDVYISKNIFFIAMSIILVFTIFYADLLSFFNFGGNVIFAIKENDVITIVPVVGFFKKKIQINIDEIKNYKIIGNNKKQYVLYMTDGSKKELSIKDYLGLAYSDPVENDFSSFILEIFIKHGINK